MDKKTLYANIIIDISHEKLDRTFQYRIPENLLDQIHPGTPVEIPFGRSNRKIRGYVVEVTEEPEFAPERIKPVSHVIREGIPIEGQLIALAAWMRENFGGTMNQALKTVLPVKQKTTEKEQRLIWLKPDQTLFLLRQQRSLCWENCSASTRLPGRGFWKHCWNSRLFRMKQ